MKLQITYKLINYLQFQTMKIKIIKYLILIIYKKFYDIKNKINNFHKGNNNGNNNFNKNQMNNGNNNNNQNNKIITLIIKIK